LTIVFVRSVLRRTIARRGRVSRRRWLRLGQQHLFDFQHLIGGEPRHVTLDVKAQLLTDAIKQQRALEPSFLGKNVDRNGRIRRLDGGSSNGLARGVIAGATAATTAAAASRGGGGAATAMSMEAIAEEEQELAYHGRGRPVEEEEAEQGIDRKHV